MLSGAASTNASPTRHAIPGKISRRFMDRFFETSISNCFIIAEVHRVARTVTLVAPLYQSFHRSSGGYVMRRDTMWTSRL